MNSGMKVTLRIWPTGRVDRLGIVTPDGTKLIGRGDGVIVIKVPGSRYFKGVGMPQGYSGAEFEVYREVDAAPEHEWTGKLPDHTTTIRTVRVMDFPVRS